MAKERRPKKMAARVEFSPRVAVKFKDHVPSSVSDLPSVRSYFKRIDLEFPTQPFLPLIGRVGETGLNALVERARRNNPSYKPTDFSLWKQVTVPRGADMLGLARALRESGEVETAYAMRPTPPPMPPPPPPDYTPDEGFLKPAPEGIDAQYAKAFPGGDGKNIVFVDLEQGWDLGHQDLPAIVQLPGQNYDFFDHGTAVLGIVLMMDNPPVGGLGIAPSSIGKVVSQYRGDGSFNTADAIACAACHPNMNPGDVLLIEAQENDSDQGINGLPVEIYDGVYEVIRAATEAGIVVVEAAGNGDYVGTDLDGYTDVSGRALFHRGFRDSGAIMVAAGSSDALHTRRGTSNYGHRIDCFAWGDGIRTARSDGVNNALYDPYFGGTSGAAAIVAGAALVVQGLAKALPIEPFSPSTVRDLLQVGGTPSANGDAVDKIKVMPNLRAILSDPQLNVAPDLYFRDSVGHTGDPTSSLVFMSPDIIVRQERVSIPDDAFGSGSGTENHPALSDHVDPAQDQFLYVRVLNRGGRTAKAATVDLYWAPSATLITPNLWQPIGSATLADVPTGHVFTVSPAVRWASADIPAPGHYCFVAVVCTDLDPRPGPSTFCTLNDFITYVRNNNNIGWRNLNVVAGPPLGPPRAPLPFGLQKFYALPFLIPGAFDSRRSFEFEAIGGLPLGSQAFLQAPAWLAEALHPRPEIHYDNEEGFAWIPLHPSGLRKLGGALLNAESLAKCRLVVSIPDEMRSNEYGFAVRQLHEGWEAGRITWRFAALPVENRSRRGNTRKV